MKGQILKIDKTKSRYGGEVYVVYIKTWEEGSYKCWIDPKNRNYGNWREAIARGKGTIIDNMVVLNEKKRLVDADSQINIVKDNFKAGDSSALGSGGYNIPNGYDSEGNR
jgi:hypothetical protein